VIRGTIVNALASQLPQSLKENGSVTSARQQRTLRPSLWNNFDITNDGATLHYLQHKKYHAQLTPANRKRINKRATRYVFHDDKLYFRPTAKFEEREVPAIRDRTDIISSLHRLGHFGIQRTANLVQERYFWTGIFNDVKDFVGKCSACRARSITFLQPPILKSIPINDQAFYRVGIDVLGPITETPTKNKYIAVAIDYLTKWAEIRAIPNKEASTVAHFFEHDIIARHGCPRAVLSDKGLEFKGGFDRLLQKYGIDHHLTPPNHPQTNGLTEKHNSTIVTSLNKLVEDHPEKWDTKIPEFLLGYRASQQIATKVSPFYMVYARHPLLPIHLSPPTLPPLPPTATEEQEGTGGQRKRKERSHDNKDDEDDNDDRTWSWKGGDDHAMADYVTRRREDESHMTGQNR